jgi:hypothetical protein
VTVQRRGKLDGPGVHALIEAVSAPSPATHVRLVLKIYRERGYGFEYAWAQAMRTLPHSLPERAEWKGHLRAQKPLWRNAYDAPRGSGVANVA